MGSRILSSLTGSRSSGLRFRPHLVPVRIRPWGSRRSLIHMAGKVFSPVPRFLRLLESGAAG